MKIGIDARLYRKSVAGIGRYSQNLIKNILEIDKDNQYVFLMTKEDAEEFRNNIKIQDTRYKIQIIDIPHYSIAEQIKLPKIIEEENCDLWHFLNLNIPVRFRGKFVVTIHDITLFFYPARSKKAFFYKWAYKYIFKKACQNSQKIIAVSKSTKNDILKTFKIDSAKIKVIYEAADDKTFGDPPNEIIEKIKSRYAICDMPVLLYVGQWRPHKNLLGLIKAFEILRKEIPAKLAIVGKADPAYPEVQKIIDKSAYLRDIIKPGFVSEEELAAWYKAASVFVFPSFYEGFGLPGLEAMMAGLPVVASNRTSLPEIYGKAAIYFDPDNIVDIKDKISKILDDEPLRNDLIQKGYQKVKEYSWRKTAEETIKIYQEVLNGG